MPKRKYKWSDDKRKRYIKEGRGQGTHDKYLPWLKIQDLSSLGNATRTKGWTTKRQHEFFSNLERDYFLLLEWDDQVIDINEQYNLDLVETSNIAEKINIKHPIDSSTGTLIDMTTDFLINVKDYGYIARTIKPSEYLEKKRVIEKFEIERVYWEEKGVDWGIVTEKEIPKELANNIAWVHKFYYIEDQIDKEYINSFLNVLIECEKSDYSAIGLCNSFDKNFNLETGSALGILKHAIARKYILIDMNKKIDLKKVMVSQIRIREGHINDFSIS